eukprot:5209953-Ditylum_brightwellii.AAC.1
MSLPANYIRAMFFAKYLNKRAVEPGWNTAGAGIVDIPDDKGVHKNLFIQYGLLLMRNITNYANITYLG